jgi:hypothetical protein
MTDKPSLHDRILELLDAYAEGLDADVAADEIEMLFSQWVSKPRKSRPLSEDDMPGTPVFLVEDDGTVTQTVTRSETWRLGHGALVVKVKGRTGCYLAERISVPLPEPPTEER